MRGIRYFFLVFFLSFAVNPLFAQSGREVATKVIGSVVLLGMEDKNGQPISLGSGFVVKSGVVATNVHVIQGASSGYAKLVGQNRKFDIQGVIAVDAKRDLALLKVDGLLAPVLNIADDTSASIGDTVYAVGNPEGLQGTFSQGIVSGIRQIEQDKLIQITAPISPGSSGGPVVNSSAEVVGVAVATFREGQNLNFAVPSSYLKALINNMKDVVKFSDAVPVTQSSSITQRAGGDSVTEGVVVANLNWTDEPGYPSAYRLTLRNKLRDPVTDIVFVIIFFGDDGEPVHSIVAKYDQQILGSLAKTLNTTYPSTTPYPGHDIRTITKRLEARILNFKVLR